MYCDLSLKLLTLSHNWSIYRNAQSDFLQGCARAGKIPEPEGLLKLEFWRSKSQGGGIVSA